LIQLIRKPSRESGFVHWPLSDIGCLKTGLPGNAERCYELLSQPRCRNRAGRAIDRRPCREPPRTIWKCTPPHELWLKDPDGNLIIIFARLTEAELAGKPADEAPEFVVPEAA
jgi:hypothetical protein